MKIGIICAGDREVKPFLKMLEQSTETQKAMLTVHEGWIGNVNAAVLFSGVCKVNAAIAAQIMIDSFGCEAIINAGTAGGISDELEVFDTVVGAEVAYHDVDEGILTEFHPWMESIYFKADPKLLALAESAMGEIKSDHRTVIGRMVTGEQFIGDEQRPAIRAGFAPLSADMESAAIAHVCYVNRIPFIAVRTLTDTPAHSGPKAFETNCAEAARICAELIRTMLRLSERREQDEV